jgi:hypothetical protein
MRDGNLRRKNHHVEETSRRGAGPRVQRSRRRRPNEFPATGNDNNSRSGGSIGRLRGDPLQGCKRRRENEERNVGLQQHDRLSREYRQNQQPRHQLERELARGHARLNRRSGEPAALLIDGLKHRLRSLAAGLPLAFETDGSGAVKPVLSL